MVSQIFTLKALASLLSVVSVANAHMIMKTPIPYGRGSIDSAPLLNTGADFPCKNFFDMTDPVNDVNHLVPGTPNMLSFTGSAVHGGGSCQVALTKDLKPTKSSKWMVIKSIEGGCPASAEGNLPADPNGSGASTFQYTVPQGFPEGQYTIAWTWFNRIGNREMYMNCGRAAIANSKKRYAPSQPKKTIQHRDSDYPDIYKASLTDIFGGAACQINETFVLKFPNPGPDLQVVGTPNFADSHQCDNLQASFDGGSTSSGTGTGSAPDSGAGSSSAVASAAPTGAASSAFGGAPSSAATGGFGGAPTSAASAGFSNAPTGASTAAAATGTDFMGSPPSGVPSGGNPGVFASGAASASSAVATSAAATEAPASSAVATATVSPLPAATGSSSTSSTPPSTGSSSGSNAQGSACTDEGAYACSSDGTSFQRCASGMWSASIPMAAGTSCTAGISSNLSLKVINVAGSSGKRDLTFHANERRSRPHRRRSLPSSE